jgi:hypothetical protein
MTDDLNIVDLRERIAVSKELSPAERYFILNAIGGTYLVWSNEHRAWWRGGWGYSTALPKAGRYTREEALDICRRAIPTAAHIGAIAEVPVRFDDIADVLRDQVVPPAILREGGES